VVLFEFYRYHWQSDCATASESESKVVLRQRCCKWSGDLSILSPVPLKGCSTVRLVGNRKRVLLEFCPSCLPLLARDYLPTLKMVGKFIGHCLNFPTIYTGEQ
jgi:hypothetical protein